MPAAELAIWREFSRCEPIGDERGDWQTARIASVVLGTHGVKASPADLVPDYDAAWRPPPTEEEVMEKITAAMLAFGA